ncbi:16S rRNA (guanine(527)-N(7))-methyltransferase RsmG [uncultured Sphingomonas sp.]|uniref:16S rRNA (guanine(527)-N(7))-methyltransferase RsmG n=1 Tax=uncultured Sphingomonas sp. TaxID=158754 RepID=UPI0035CC83D9
MSEDEARAWVVERFGPDASGKLERLTAIVIEEAAGQNLIAPSTVASIWSRHVVDSLQLVDFAPTDGAWLDIGTGGGFPGLAVAVVRDTAVHLVEPRRRRAAFLEAAAAVMGLPHVVVHASRVEQVAARAGTISARAVGPIAALVKAARHVASRDTVWLLPRGRIGSEELAALPQYARVFHVEQSLTDSDSQIVVLRGVSGR